MLDIRFIIFVFCYVHLDSMVELKEVLEVSVDFVNPFFVRLVWTAPRNKIWERMYKHISISQFGQSMLPIPNPCKTNCQVRCCAYPIRHELTLFVDYMLEVGQAGGRAACCANILSRDYGCGARSSHDRAMIIVEMQDMCLFGSHDTSIAETQNMRCVES